MLAIGENIQILSNKVNEAVKNRDAAFIQQMVKQQAEAGANFIDLNIGRQKKRGVEIMGWIVDAVQEVTDVNLSLDTTNVAAIQEGLKHCKKQAMINSASADPERLEALMPLAKEYNAKIIALAMGKEGIPTTADGRVQLAMDVIIPGAMEVGVSMEDLYLDPLTLTVKGSQEHAMEALNAVRFFKQVMDPAPMTVVGLSNVSNTVPAENRSLINRTFLVMLLAVGLDAAILDPLDKEQWEFARIVEERDTSTGLGQLLVNLYDATAAMEELDPDLVDMSDPDQEAVYRTVRILENKVIYADSYLQV